MLVLIIGTIVLVVVISQFAYSTWVRQNLEWSITKKQDEARAESGTMYTLMRYLRDLNAEGPDSPMMYLSETDQEQDYQVFSTITNASGVPCDAAQIWSCKVINTVFSKSPFVINHVQYFTETRAISARNDADTDPIITWSEGDITHTPNFRLPILQSFR